jgi:ADP-heptose:LPS heptosyltransferase
VGEKSFDALIHHPHIDALIIVNKKMPVMEYLRFFFKIFNYRYDMVIDFQRNPRSALATLISGAKKRISFDGRHRNHAYNMRIPSPHVNVYAALSNLMLLHPLNIYETADCLPDMYITEEDRKWADEVWMKLKLEQNDVVVAISPVSVKPYRIWPAEHFATLCDHIIDKYNVKLLFAWGPREFHFIEAILQKMKHKPNVDYRISSIKQLKALFSKCALFIGNDHDPRHIAIQPKQPGIQNIELRSVIKTVDEVIESITKKRNGAYV